jgi:hypothetical protein
MSDHMSEGWDGETRIADGTRVYRMISGDWAIVTSEETNVIVECPCCNRSLKSAHAARMVADTFLPVSKPS